MRNLFILLMLSLLLTNCANIKQPTGGDKDEINPTMIKSIPEHNSTNFKGEEIVVYFDEQIESKNLLQELIITPDDEISYKEVPGKKYIKLKLKDTLRSNTTYNFNFGNSIVDITEKNPSDNARIAFSTGPNIDTAKISGRIINMHTQKPIENAIALLHYNLDTLDPEKHKPTYFAKSDDDGYFTIENLPIDTFRLYAIEDANNNLLYNYGKENISEYNERVIPSNHDSTDYTLYVSSQDTRPLKMISSEHLYNASKIKFNKGLYSYEINDTLVSKKTDKERSLLIFHKISSHDSIAIPISVTDSVNNNFDTTIYIKSNPDGDTLSFDFTLTLEPKSDNIKSIPSDIKISFSLPLKSAVLDTFTLIKDDTDTLINFNYQYNLLNINELKIITDKINAQKANFSFSGVEIISVFNDTIENLRIDYKIPDETKFGQIQGSIQTNKENIILELINSSYKVVKSLQVDKSFDFIYIEPGSYRLRAIEDSNGNGKWDSGNHQTDTPPENVFIDEEEILIKANWIIQDRVFKF